MKPTNGLLLLGLVFASAGVLEAPLRPFPPLAFTDVLGRELPVIAMKMRRPCTSQDSWRRFVEGCR